MHICLLIHFLLSTTARRARNCLSARSCVPSNCLTDRTCVVQEGGPILIARLQDHGINAADIKKLQEAGLWTVESVRA